MARLQTFFFLLLFLPFVSAGANDNNTDADALITAFLRGDTTMLQKQLVFFREIANCDPKCLDYRQQAFVFMMEIGKDNHKYQFVREELALFIAEYYTAVFNKDFILDCLMSVRQPLEERANVAKLFKLYYQFGGMMFQEQYYLKAVEFGKLCLSLDEKSVNDPGRIINLTNTIGLSWSHLQKPDSAMRYFEQAIQMAEQRNDKAWIGLLNGNMALAYLQKEDTAKAIELLGIDMELSGKYGWKFSALNAMGMKMNLLARTGRVAEASVLQTKLLESLDSVLSLKPDFYTPYTTLADYFEYTKAYNQALFFRKKADSIKDILSAREMRSRAEMDDQLYFNQQYERSVQSRFQEIYDRQQRWKWALVVAVALMGLLVFVLFLMHKRNKLLGQIAMQSEALKAVNADLELAKSDLLLKQEVLRKQSEELENANRKLAEMDNFRQATTNMIVHDLKNSLYNIIGLSSMHEGNKAFETISETSKKMLRMVLNILDIRKFEEARIQLHCVGFSVFELIELVLKDLELSFRNKSLSVRVECEKDLQLFADKDLIRRLLENLLMNAINHTALDKPIIVKATNLSSAVRIEVINHGSFIPEDKRQTVFEAFMQAGPSKGEIRSNGLGLAFSKMVVVRHEGSIGVESEAGQTTKFWFELPAMGTQTKSGKMISQTTHFTSEMIKLSEETMRFPDELKQLLQLEVYDMSRVLSVLQNFHTKGNETATEWKKAVENAVYHCDNIRYKELVKMLEDGDLNRKTL